MKRILVRLLCVFIDLAWLLLAVMLIWHWHVHYSNHRAGPHYYHVRISGGDIVYRDYWTTNPPPPFVREKPWYEYLQFTNENHD